MRRLRVLLRVVLPLLVLLASSGALAERLARPLEKLGPYQLGARYEVMKKLAGFTEDPGRSKPAEGLQAAKIIDRKILDTPSIQRFTFRHGKLIRVSIVFGDKSVTEERVKEFLAAQYGDPGPRAGGRYIWVGTPTGTAAVLPAQDGYWMASLIESSR